MKAGVVPPRVGQAPREWVAAKKGAHSGKGVLNWGRGAPSSVYPGAKVLPVVWVPLCVQSVSPLSTRVSCSVFFSRKTSVTWMRHHDEKSENLLMGWGTEQGPHRA